MTQHEFVPATTEVELDQRKFDTAVVNAIVQLVKQNKKSKEGTVCMYRMADDDGTCLKCAVGWLISDEHYSDIFETLPVTKSTSLQTVLARSMKVNVACVVANMRTLVEMQACHDLTYDGENFGQLFLDTLERRIDFKLIARAKLILNKPTGAS